MPKVGRIRRSRPPARPAAAGPSVAHGCGGSGIGTGSIAATRSRSGGGSVDRAQRGASAPCRAPAPATGSRGRSPAVYTSWTAVIASPAARSKRQIPKFERNIIWRVLRIRSSADWCRAAIVCSAANAWSGRPPVSSLDRDIVDGAGRVSGRRPFGQSGRSSSRGVTRQRQSGRCGRVQPGRQLRPFGAAPARCRRASHGRAAGPGCAAVWRA